MSAAVVARSQSLIPPTTAHGHQQLGRILVAHRLRACKPQKGLLILTLGIQQVDQTTATSGIADALQAYGLGSHLERMLLGRKQPLIMCESLQDVGDLAKGL